MRLTKLLLEEASSLPRHFRFIRYGKLKWRDYQARDFEPPYWYKWGKESPYSPEEQAKIRSAEHVGWYQYNIEKIKVVAPDDWLYKHGDTVKVLIGKDKGKTGIVTQVFPQGNVIFVAGRNCKYEKNDGSYTRKEQALQHHQVSLLDPLDNEETDAEIRVTEDGEKVRVSLRSGHVIHWPPEYLPDGSTKENYVTNTHDTDYDTACEVTYKPSLDDWEDELAKHYEVKDPARRTTYWY